MNIAIAGVITKPITPDALGGTEAFTYLLVEGLVKKGHTVSLYCAKGSQTHAKQIEICSSEEAMGTESNVEFVYPYTLLEIRQILSDIKRNGFDIVHVNFLKTFLLSYFADQIDIPILTTIHRDFFMNPRLAGVYEKIGLSSHEHFVFVSERAKRLSLIDHNTHVVRNGINIDAYPLSDHFDQKQYLWLSRIDPLKGPKEAVQAALAAHVPLVLSGDIDRQKYQEYFDREIQSALGETITYEKPQSLAHKLELYQRAKAFVFPIQWEEPFGLVVVEALACGTPVITFDRGAMSEIITHGVTGFVVPPGEGVAGIARAISKLEKMTEGEYRTMRLACHQSVVDRFSSSRMVDEYEALYKQLIASEVKPV